MKTYKVKIKNGTRSETIKASSELEAKVKYCEKRGFNYRHLAGKLEVIGKTGQTRQDSRTTSGQKSRSYKTGQARQDK